MAGDRSRSGPGPGVEPAMLTSTPSATTATTTGTSPCESLTGMARQMCFALRYGLAV